MADPKKEEAKKGTGTTGAAIPPKPEPEKLTPQQEAERQALIKKVAEEHAAKAAAEAAKGPNMKELAAKALEQVQAKRAEQPEATAPTNGKPDRWPDRKRKSTISNPVKFVWEMADAMTAVDPTVRRKDVVEACIDAGVAGYTARTQYQQWYTFRRESQRNAAKAELERQQAALKTAAGGAR